jgi:hypothetical protein
LEGYQNFSFNLDGENQAFYTRNIGIENFQSVPIIAGARMFGKIGKANIGLLDIQTAEKNGVPSTNNAVVRYRKT